MYEFASKKYFQGDAHERHLKQVKKRKQIVREMAKEYIYEYLSTHPCVKCGGTDPVVLEFHHVKDKVISIAAMGGAGYSLESIQKEIEKCEVLCANCHRRLTIQVNINCLTKSRVECALQRMDWC